MRHKVLKPDTGQKNQQTESSGSKNPITDQVSLKSVQNQQNYSDLGEAENLQNSSWNEYRNDNVEMNYNNADDNALDSDNNHQGTDHHAESDMDISETI